MPREEALPDHYEVLGVSCDADPAALKAAFRLKALRSHPDKPGGSDEAFRRVMQAYDVLSCDRAAYDAPRAAAPPAAAAGSRPPWFSPSKTVFKGKFENLNFSACLTIFLLH